jgi:hypothetical protein
MKVRRYRSIFRHRHLSCMVIAALFSVILIFGTGGVGLTLQPPQWQEVQASVQPEPSPQAAPSTQAAPLPTPLCNPNSPTLRLSSAGAKVIELQRILTQIGYGSLLGQDGIGGKFAIATQNAVKKFQQDNRLQPIDGKVGPMTWRALCSKVAAMSTVPTPGAAIGDCSPEKKKDSLGRGHWLYKKGPWSFEYDIIDGLGLVLYYVKAGNEELLDSIAIPQFGIKYVDSNGGLTSRIVRFCDGERNSGTTTFKQLPLITTSNEAKGIDNLRWTYAMRFNERDSLVGTLLINYDIVIRWKAVENCETAGIECYRLIPKVTFEWVDSSNSRPTLNTFTAFYRLDYALQTGMYPIKDPDTFTGGASALGAQEVLLPKERVFSAVRPAASMKTEIDNIHAVNRLFQVIGIPGCTPYPFECVHMHWRWGDLPLLDPMVEPSTDAKIGPRGKTYLVPGQSIDIAIIKDNPGEDVFPDNPASKVNGEMIATTRDGYKAIGALSPIVWYMSSVENKKTDTFFRHGIFVLNQ